MNPIIRLQDYVQEMDIVSDEFQVFLNIRTGEFVMLSDEELRAAEESEDLGAYPEWQRESIRAARAVLDTNDYRQLPSQFDIHEYAIVRLFCYSVEDEALHRLLNSIQGRGAFRYFKDTIHKYGIAADWYAYRQQPFLEIAVEWLESHRIAYRDD